MLLIQLFQGIHAIGPHIWGSTIGLFTLKIMFSSDPQTIANINDHHTCCFTHKTIYRILYTNAAHTVISRYTCYRSSYMRINRRLVYLENNFSFDPQTTANINEHHTCCFTDKTIYRILYTNAAHTLISRYTCYRSSYMRINRMYVYLVPRK